MSARKYKTLGNVLYIIDRKGKTYLERGKVKRSTTEFYYELATNTGTFWAWDSTSYDTRAQAMNKVKKLAGTV
jgi:hypothetical protein